MRGREKDLLDDIERGALDSSTPLADTLRKCVMLGGRAGSVELRAWASLELNGYGGDDELPDWRIVAASIEIDFVNMSAIVRGRAVSPMELPEFARDLIKEEYAFRMGVGALEALLDSAEPSVRLGIPMGQDLVTYWNHQVGSPYQQIQRIYWDISKVAVRAVIDRVRTTLAELVAEIRAGMPSDADVPSPELATQAVQIAVHGRGHRIVVNNAQATDNGVVNNAQASEGGIVTQAGMFNSGLNVREFVDAARLLAKELNLGAAQEADLLADVGSMERELDRPEPRQGVIRAFGRSVRAVLEQAVGGIVATAASPEVMRAIETISSYDW